MDVTELPITTLTSPVQCWKVELPMDVTDEGIVILVSPQQQKAELPMDVTDEGIVILFNFIK